MKVSLEAVNSKDLANYGIMSHAIIAQVMITTTNLVRRFAITRRSKSKGGKGDRENQKVVDIPSL